MEDYPDYGEEKIQYSLYYARQKAIELAIAGDYDTVCIYEELYDDKSELVSSDCIDRVWRKKGA